MKIYGGALGRRSATDMREYEAKGYLDRAPQYNSVFNALENPALTPILKGLIEETAAPLRSIESDFAVDSSGFSTKRYTRWFDHKYGKKGRPDEWIKAHIMCGVKTNVVTSVEITDSKPHDSPFFKPLVEVTNSRFTMRTVSADKAYIGQANLELIEGLGATPLIPFKSNNNPYRNSAAWRKAWAFQKSAPDEFSREYHKRSNVETTFAMIKAKFGGYVRSKTKTARINEVLCKVLCHNLCCLVQASYERRIAS